MSPRAGGLFAFAVGLLSAAWFVPYPVPGLALLVTGLSLLITSLLVLGLALWHSAQSDRQLKSLAGVVANDAAASFSTDADGCVMYQNDAATERFGDQVNATLTSALGDMFASPAAVLHRLQGKAQARGAAREDLVLRRGHVRLSVHQAGEDMYLWRLEELGDRGPTGRTGENISLPMMTVSRTGTILFMNEAARRFLGGRETTLDRVFTDFPVRNGQVMPVSGKDGQVPSLVCEIDITAGRRELYLLPAPEGPVMTSDEWSVVDGLPIPLIKIDKTGKISMANRRARDLLQDEQLIGERLADLVEGLGRPVSEWLREAHAGRHIGRTEVVRATKPEDDLFLQISLGRVVEDGETALVAVMQDATELKNLELQFVQSQKMEAIGQLAGGVAHDFNNLLTAISGHCDLLLIGRDENDPEFSDLSQIHQNANRAAALVRQLLAFSRKQTLRPEKLDLTESLSDLTHLLNRLVGEKILLELDHDDSLLSVRADRRQLDQVLMNLIVNARDAMPDGGEIRVETRNVILSSPLIRDRATVPAGDYVTIRVVDQGTGIPSDKIGKIFEPFFTTKKAGKGTGLGLSMAYGIVKQMGGYIFVDSIPGSGTTFSLYFPVSRDDDFLEDMAPDMTQTHLAAPAETVPEPLLNSDEEVALADEQDGGDGLTSSVETEDALASNSAEAPDDTQSDASETETGLGSTDGDGDVLGAVQAELQQSDEELSRDDLVGAVTDANLPGQKEPSSPADAAADDGPLPIPTHSDINSGRGIVLLVEDEAPVRAFASRALRMRGYTVLEAENAEEALRTLEDTSLNVDVFVTDVIMPGMDGPTWVAQALQDRPGVKVVFVSGYAEDSVSEHQSRIPNSVFLPKPFSLTDLTQTVQRQFH